MPLGSSKSRRESRQRLREHLFGSDRAVEAVHESDEDVSDTPRGVKERFTRTSSMIAKRTSSRISLNPLSKSLSSTSLVREVSVEPVDEKSLVDEVKQRVFNDTLAAMNHKSPPLREEDDEIERIISPIRRRSLFTPGLATRDPSNILRKPPIPRSQTSDDRDHYFNSNLSEFSPLARLAALDLANQGRMSPVSRSATPSDVDYGHLGGLGSLRITNGVASPVPSMRSTVSANRKSSNLRHQNDYLDNAVPVLKEIHRRSGEYVDPPDTAWRADRLSGEIGRVGRAMERGGSPLKHERSNASFYPDNDINEKISPIEVGGLSTDRTFFMAQNYMDELPRSPFTAFEPESCESFVETTSKPSELDDKLFDQQSLNSHSSQQSLRRRTSHLPELEQGMGSFGDEVLGMIADVRGSRSTLGTRQAIEQLSQDQSGPSSAVSNTDSGYGSSTSLKSLQKSIADYPDEKTQSLRQARIGNEKDLSRLRSAPLAASNSTSSSNSRPSLLAVPSSSVFGGSTYTSAQTSTEAIPTLASNKSSNSKKLQKSRPKSQPPPLNRITVQGVRDLSAAHIPPVPIEIAARNAARLLRLPPLEHTLPSVDHEGFGDYMPMPAPLSAPLRFPSPTRSEKRGRSTVDKSEHPNTQRSIQKPFNLRRLSQSFRRSSRQQEPDTLEHVEGLADLGDITESLGQSPYDVAGAYVHDRLLKRHSIAYPYQITTSMGRTKATTGMNEEEAAELSRLRGIHGRRTSLGAENDYFSYGTLVDTNHRPTTHFNDRGGIPGKTLRADHAFADAPPVPAIPVAVQVERREAEIAQRTSFQGKQTSDRPALSRPANQRYSTTNFAELRPDWQGHRDAWAQRRKSAVKVLVASEERHRSATPSPTRSTLLEKRHRSDGELMRERLDASALYHSKALPPSPSNLQSDHTQNLAIPKGTVARLSGRFEGGLGYGYEPGLGVGGSAGTRGMRTGASRKSVDVSRGFGLDLSDVPIFVSPSQ